MGASVARGAGGPRGSALRASREDKGQNSYYYAHDTPTVAGSSPAPQLLSRAASTDSSPGQLEAVPIERYSFLDEGKKVKVYITLPEATLEEAGCSLETAQQSLRCVLLTAGGERHVLRLPKLHGPIAAGGIKLKPGKGSAVITLTKLPQAGNEIQWPKLAAEITAQEDDGICIDGRGYSS